MLAGTLCPRPGRWQSNYSELPGPEACAPGSRPVRATLQGGHTSYAMRAWVSPSAVQHQAEESLDFSTPLPVHPAKHLTRVTCRSNQITCQNSESSRNAVRTWRMRKRGPPREACFPTCHADPCGEHPHAGQCALSSPSPGSTSSSAHCQHPVRSPLPRTTAAPPRGSPQATWLPC